MTLTEECNILFCIFSKSVYLVVRMIAYSCGIITCLVYMTGHSRTAATPLCLRGASQGIKSMQSSTNCVLWAVYTAS